MRGLAFPTNAVYDREASYDRDYGTPRSNNADAIPIDPALSGNAVDPSMTGEGSGRTEEIAELPMYFPKEHTSPHKPYSQEQRQYSQGPQGDPFAPQPPAPYLPIEEEQPPPTPRPVKRKRRPKREEECGFCQGNDSHNQDGDAEPMVSCDECGRSGHPSCMELAEVGDVVRSYAWRCIECKICEICQQKGDDNRILFCDFCDRGWHMDCLQPPIEESPPGRWHCPMCPPLIEGPDGMEYYPPNQDASVPEDEDEVQEVAGPSTSRPANANKRKGKQKALFTDDSDENVDEEDGDSSVATKNRRRRKSTKKGRRRQDSDDEEPSSPLLPKRSRIRASSPVTPRPRMVVRLRLPPKGKGKEREDDDGPPKGLFDDILGVDDRDTTKTNVDSVDKQRYEKSRLAAEDKLAPPPPPPLPEIPESLMTGSLYRPLRSSTLHQVSIPATMHTPGMSESPAPSTPGAASVPAAGPQTLRIRTIRFGEFDIQTWYDAPFPEEYANIPDGRMWICEFCLKYMKSRFGAVRHRMKCKVRHPPGDEIYRDGAISVFEVDGRKNKIYCQNLCLLSKMFLDHKSLFYDVEPFLFYVMTEVDDAGARFVGYFSKEKRSPKDYNVSCIMTLPVRQRQGWGNLLIDFSYLLSKKEQRAGSPEKPLSGLGALGYRNYWTLALMRYLDSAPEKPQLEDISIATSMTIEDIHTTLTQQNMISAREVTPPPVRPSPGQSFKFPKGRKHGIARRHLQRTQTNDDVETAPKAPFHPPTQYTIRWDRGRVAQYLATWEAKGYLQLKPEKLKWSPFLLTRIKKPDGTEIVATESSMKVDPIMTDSTPAPTTQSPSTPLNGGRHPSVSIFDDDNVTASGSRNLELRSHSKERDDVELPVFEFPETAQSDKDRSVSNEIPDSSPTKRGRGRPRGSTTRALQNHSNGNSIGNELPNGGRRTRSDVGRVTDNDQSLADDEALAAQLALEERRSSRSLRIRLDQAPDLRRTASSTSVTRSSSPRKKRRRVDSSPDSESASIHSMSAPANGTTTRVNGSIAMSHQRPSSKLLNGSTIGQDGLHPAPLSSRLNVEPPSLHSPTPKTPTTSITEHSEPMNVKSEVPTADFPGPASRHSVPSDDTVIAVETVQSIHSENTDKTRQANEIVTQIGIGESGDVEMLGDEDADGDPDADAEGDPDADADADADAEGEEDLDAEGEIDAEGELDVEVTF